MISHISNGSVTKPKKANKIQTLESSKDKSENGLIFTQAFAIHGIIPDRVENSVLLPKPPNLSSLDLDCPN